MRYALLFLPYEKWAERPCRKKSSGIKNNLLEVLVYKIAEHFYSLYVCFIRQRYYTPKLLLRYIYILVLTWFRVQLGVNKHEQIFKRQQNLQFTYYIKLQMKSCYFLLIIYEKKHHRKSRHTEFSKRADALCNAHSFYKDLTMKLSRTSPFLSV